MTYKTDDINLVYKIIEWCKDKYSREECDSEVLKLYELACKARLYLSGRALDEQEYYDKYGNRILELAKKYGIYSSYDEIINQIKRPASTSPVHQYSKKDIKISYSDIIEINKKMERSIREIDRKREIGLYKMYHRRRRKIISYSIKTFKFSRGNCTAVLQFKA